MGWFAHRVPTAWEMWNTGAKFTSQASTESPDATGMRTSVDGCGRTFDSAVVERLWRTLKYEDTRLKDHHRAGKFENIPFLNVLVPIST